jgi:hypothetical protein
MRTASLIIGSRANPVGDIVVFLLATYRYFVFTPETETCEDKPGRVGGQTTTG